MVPLCLNFCDLCRIIQDRILEWLVIPFSSESSQPKDPTQVSHIRRSFIVWTTRKAHCVGVPSSRELPQSKDWTQVSCIADRKWSEPWGNPKNTGMGACPFPSYLPDPGIKIMYPALKAYSLSAELPGKHMWVIESPIYLAAYFSTWNMVMSVFHIWKFVDRLCFINVEFPIFPKENLGADFCTWKMKLSLLQTKNSGTGF